jgi:Ca2+-binding RTX toxin-like protein
LAANVENLFYSGVGNFVGTGNGLNNVIVGGAGDDILAGGGGSDRLYGGDGADIVVLSELEDEYLVELVDGGVRITDLISGRDGDILLIDIERLSFADGTFADVPVLAGRGTLSREPVEYPSFRPYGFDDGDPWWFVGARNLDAEVSGC